MWRDVEVDPADFTRVVIETETAVHDRVKAEPESHWDSLDKLAMVALQIKNRVPDSETAMAYSFRRLVMIDALRDKRCASFCRGMDKEYCAVHDAVYRAAATFKIPMLKNGTLAPLAVRLREFFKTLDMIAKGFPPEVDA